MSDTLTEDEARRLANVQSFDDLRRLSSFMLNDPEFARENAKPYSWWVNETTRQWGRVANALDALDVTPLGPAANDLWREKLEEALGMFLIDLDMLTQKVPHLPHLPMLRIALGFATANKFNLVSQRVGYATRLNPMEPLAFARFHEVSAERSTTCSRPRNEWDQFDWSMAVLGEFGEVANLLKKLRRGDQVDGDDIADEFADVVAYLFLFADHLGINLSDAILTALGLTPEDLAASA